MVVLDKLSKTCITYCLKRYAGKCLSARYATSSQAGRPGRSSKLRVLGIESSCDDTGVAIVDGRGEILANALHSQTSKSVEMGGVVLPFAEMAHRAHIGGLVQEALTQACMDAKELDAVAVSVEPGLVPCLGVGLNQAKQLVREHRVPLVPIHHMEAHALTARMAHNVDFPFLVFLLSGGHCLLAVARGVDDFLLLGSSLDIAPGECYDKLARNLKLKNLPQCTGLSGGASVELMAHSGDPDQVSGVNVMLNNQSCHFSFNGLLEAYRRTINKEEAAEGIQASAVLSSAADVCASFQQSVLKHLLRPLQRAFYYTEQQRLITQHKTLVLSGGVACNHYLRDGIQQLCEQNGYQLVCPPPHLCTDNGIMVAWNGVEKLRLGKGVVDDPDLVDVRAKSPLGKDISEHVTSEGIKVSLKEVYRQFDETITS